MMGDASLAGLDEAGRGALAGPVVAGACMVVTELYPRRRAHIPLWGTQKRKTDGEALIADSKSLSPQERETAYAWITAHCMWGVGVVENDVIDDIGIVPSNHRAMLMALGMLRAKAEPKSLLVDGRDAYVFPLPHHSVIRGDQVHPCIAAASIVAKVTRDRIMRERHAFHPEYGFADHKGYGSPEHISALKEHGPCVLHRQSFIRGILENQKLALDFLAA